MKNKLLILIILLSSLGYSQNPDSKDFSRTFISINNYKLLFRKELTKNDSLNFKFKDGDTLVLVKNLHKKISSVPYEYKDSTFLNLYKKIAFKKLNDSNFSTMKYWKDDINIFFSKSISNKVKNEIAQFVKKIDKSVDSLNIKIIKNPSKANYFIYYKEDFEYEPKINGDQVNYYLHWNKENQITRGSIKLNPEYYFNDRLRIYELKKMFLETLGYFKFSDNLDCDNYFSNCYSDKKKLSSIDLELIKYHYSYGICKGTTLKVFENQHIRAKKLLTSQNRRINFIHLSN